MDVCLYPMTQDEKDGDYRGELLQPPPQQLNALRPILVGYAFGPKKMKTMGVVMAEASMAVSVVATDRAPRGTRSSSGACASTSGTMDYGVSSSNKKKTMDTSDHSLQEEDGSSVALNSNTAAADWDVASVISAGSDMMEYGGSSSSGTIHFYIRGSGGGMSNGGGYGTERPVNGESKGNGSMSAWEDNGLKNMSSVFPSPNGSVADTTSLTASSVSPLTNTTAWSDCASFSNGSETKHATTTTLGAPPLVPAVRRPSTSQNLHQIRVSFVPLDLDAPLEEQHGGKFDAILHKLTEDILLKSQLLHSTESKSDFRLVSCHDHHHQGMDDPYYTLLEKEAGIVEKCDVASERQAIERIERLIRYKENHPDCCIVDHPNNVQTLMSRSDIAFILSQCLEGVTTKSGIPVRTPKFQVLNQHIDGMNLQDEAILKIARQIDHGPFSYPLIVKPLSAAGTVDSHKMGIILGRKGLKRLQGPCLLQEYANHDELLYKVYVLGNKVWVFPRPSLPNLPIGELLTGETDDHYVEFDSQRPYPKLSDFGPAHSQVELHHDNPTVNTHKLSCDEIRPVADCIRKAFGLEVFGFDILLTVQDSSNATCQEKCQAKKFREMLVVDVNYFPSYKEVTNFSTLLAQYLAQCGIEGRVKSLS